jgi:opacity protein-like surface antigen
MNKAILFSFLIALLTSSVKAQGWLPQGARSAGIGESSVTFIDAFSFHHNPGALGFLEKGTVGFSYQSRYLLKELQSQGFAVAQPLKRGVVSVGGQFYGYEQFRTNRLGAGYSMKLSDNIAAGVQLNYLSARLDPAYGVRHTLSGEFGLLGKISDDLSIGFSVMNIGRAKLSDFQDDRFSTLIRLGASYQIVDDLLITAEITQEVAFQARLRAGFEYNPEAVSMLFIRCGVQSNPMELAFGFGVDFESVKLDLATQYNQLLGWTPSAGLIIDFYSPDKK